MPYRFGYLDDDSIYIEESLPENMGDLTPGAVIVFENRLGKGLKFVGAGSGGKLLSLNPKMLLILHSIRQRNVETIDKLLSVISKIDGFVREDRYFRQA